MITIQTNPRPFAYCITVEESYTNHFPGIYIGNTIASSSSTYNDLVIILASTLSTVKINYKGCGEYNLLDAFFMSVLPLDPHTCECPTYQKAKKN